MQYAAGILNGTCNFILSTMKETGRAFEDVLAEAQERGYAETPPDLDVDGIDTVGWMAADLIAHCSSLITDAHHDARSRRIDTLHFIRHD